MLETAYSDYQIGPLENFHQLVEDTLVIVRSGLEVLLQYALRLDNGLKGQLLIGHRVLPIRCRPTRKGRDQAAFWDYPLTFCFSIGICAAFCGKKAPLYGPATPVGPVATFARRDPGA